MTTPKEPNRNLSSYIGQHFKGLEEDAAARKHLEERTATVRVDGDLENFGRWPKRKKVAPKKPEYMCPDLQGLPEEFRRLAAEAGEYADFVNAPDKIYEASAYMQYGLKLAYEQAAQMLEERLNG